MPNTAVRRETASWVEPVGRIGLASQGVLYAVVGLLALQVASGNNDRVDQHGAMYAVVTQPFGRFLLLVLMAGLALHCAWRILLFLRGSPGDDDAGDYVKRIAHLGRAATYAAFTWGAFEVLTDSDEGGSPQHDGVARVLDWPGGPVVIAVIGVVIIGTGLWHASKIVTRPFEDDLDLDDKSDGVRRFLLALGSIGFLARGLCFVLVGWFVVQAAVDHDPAEGGGLDHALKQVVNAEYGPDLLRVLAVGVFLFGAYRIADAIFRKRHEVANA